MFLLQGCGVSLICEQGPSMIFWLNYIISRGGSPSIQKITEVTQ
jgi:hypothetical protein